MLQNPITRSTPPPLYQLRSKITLTAHAVYMTEEAYRELWRRTIEAFESLHPFLGD